ncbi:MAG: hypothetical protein JSW27_16715 [Phycisphaerales bacterium]|nr:MAG: hypothetical protein JSW27_16715 [Phycisphaerales bacterium]
MAQRDLDDILNDLGRNATPPDVERLAEDIAERLRRDLVRTHQSEHSKWKAYIMRNRKTQLTAAAVIVVAVLIGLHRLGAPLDGTSIVWADVLEQVDSVPAVTYKATMKITYPNDQVFEDESDIYLAGDQGTRIDTYRDGDLFMVKYWLPPRKLYLIVHPQLKRYMQQTLSDEQIAGGLQQQDPRQFLKWVLTLDYHELGRREIDGIEVEGIEATREDIETLRIWVDVETKWPVRIESDGKMREAGQMVPVGTVMQGFQWHDEIDPSLLDPNIPEDYTLSPPR